MIASRHRRYWSLFVGTSFVSAGVFLAACEDDTDPNPGTTSTIDSGSPGTDGSSSSGDVISSSNDSSTTITDTGSPITDTGTGADTSTVVDTGVDAGPTLTTVIGSTGYIQVRADYAVADFFEDDTILHWSNAPQCVVHVRSSTKPLSPAGTITIAGPFVGSDGAAPAAIVITPDATNSYAFGGPVLSLDDALQVQVDSTQSSAFPALPVQSMRPSATDKVVIMGLTPDAANTNTISTTQPLNMTWTVPGGALNADKQIAIAITVFTTATIGAKNSLLHCAFPLTAGQATIPANVLADMKVRAGNASAPGGSMHVFSGSAKEVTAGTTNIANYVIEVARTDSTSIENDFQIELQ